MKMNLKLCAVGSFASVPARCPTIWHCGAVLVIRDTRLDAWRHHWWRPAHVSTSCQVWLNTPFTVYFVHMSVPLFTQTYCYTHTHTHTFNGPLSRTTWVSRYQKGKTNLDFTEARDNESQWHQLSSGRMPFPPPNQQRQSTYYYTHTHTPV